MVRHIVSWNFKEGFSEMENKVNACHIKEKLESLNGCIDGLIELKVNSNMLPSSDRNIMLNSLFESDEALAGYQVHPEHKKAAEFVRSVTQNRVCIDYRE